MISNLATGICAVMVCTCAIFLFYGFASNNRLQLVKKLYLILCATFVTWPLALICMRFTASDNTLILEMLDAVTYLGASSAPVLMLLISVAFVTNCDKLPRWCYLFLIVPVLTNIIVWTNPLHHLQYQVFSIIRSEIVFGPYIYVSGGYNYIVLLSAVAVLVGYGFKNDFRLFWAQITMLIIGALVPLVVNCYATFSGVNVSIAATPISFVVTLLCNYLAIYKLHMLDIVPMATQHILDWIPDGYLILNKDGLVIDNNRPFRMVFGKLLNVSANKTLRSSLDKQEGESKTALYHLLSGIESCAKSRSPVTYEQSVSVEDPETRAIQKNYYMLDITPLEISDHIVGFVVIFKDITQVRKSMQQVQEGQARMMEQERLALLGQMVGGLAHNLKTPIMGIAGCSSSIETLLTEADASLGDPDVTDDDYREIHEEIREWLNKIRSSCSYMSDIITAVKGQAASAATTENRDFTLDELLKRTSILMRHELQSGGCKLTQEPEEIAPVMMHGDITSLVQVLNNLISNAVYAEQDAQLKEISICVELSEQELTISVKDHGKGIEPQVMAKLFQEMTTTKGTKGTGLGVYISNTLIRGKFGGQMWAKDNPTGGAIIGFTIPRQNGDTIQFQKIQEVSL